MHCGEVNPNPVYFTLEQKISKSGSRGEANFVAKVLIHYFLIF
jgi:hypothetical protein